MKLKTWLVLSQEGAILIVNAETLAEARKIAENEEIVFVKHPYVVREVNIKTHGVVYYRR